MGARAQDLQWQHLTGGVATQPMQEIGKLPQRLARHADDPVSRTQSRPVVLAHPAPRQWRNAGEHTQLARQTRPWRISSMALRGVDGHRKSETVRRGDRGGVFTPITRPALSVMCQSKCSDRQEQEGRRLPVHPLRFHEATALADEDIAADQTFDSAQDRGASHRGCAVELQVGIGRGAECVNNFETPVAWSLVSNAALPRVRAAGVLEG